MSGLGACGGGHSPDKTLLAHLAAREERHPDAVFHALETLASRAYNLLQAGWDETAAVNE
jgi:hypothetical protein